MERLKVFGRKNRRVYRQRSMRFPVALIFILLILLPVAGRYIEADLVWETFPMDLAIISAGFLILLLVEGIDSWLYPDKTTLVIRVLLLTLRFAAIALIIWQDNIGTSLPIIAMFFYAIYFYYGIIPTVLSGFILFSLFPTTFDLASMDQLGWVYLTFMVLFAGLIKMDERNQKRNQELYRELEQYAARSINLAKQEERDRISRDLHDSLGHYLVAVNIQIQKAAAYREISAEESIIALEQAQQAASEAIREMRKTLKDLREIDNSFDFLTDVKGLVDGAQNYGFLANLVIEGSEAGFSELVLITLYQVVQEGLTNIEKHAQASQVDINIMLGRRQVRLSIIDDGVGFSSDAIDETQSFGLKGIHERVAMVGGRMDIQSEEGAGTKLLLTLPKKGYA